MARSGPPDFPAATQDQWRALVDRALGGAPFESLVSKTYDRIEIAPLYAAFSGQSDRAMRAEEGAWRIFTRLDHPDLDAAIEQALVDLANGADGLQLVCANSPSAFGFGLLDLSAAAAERFFERLSGPLRRLDVECAALSDAAAADALETWAGRGLTHGSHVSLSIDPLGESLAHEPNWPRLGAVVAALHARGWRGRCFGADARRINAAGGSEAQELAFALASGLACLRGMERGGLSLGLARELVTFRLALDTEQFLGVAKLRALRRLWARVEDVCGLPPRPLRLHAESAWRMMAQRDPWTNILRAAVACFSAALGGADAIAILPFTQALGLPDPIARRLARNTQLVLLQESHLEKVADPAAGSGAFEALTSDLCDHAWNLFQEIERQGGLGRALADGGFQKKVVSVRLERERNIAHRAEAFVGVSEYPDLSERSVATLAPLSGSEAREGGASACFALFRGAELFERLRDRSDAQLAATGARPRVFLAALGSAMACGGTLAFAKNLFEAGGIESVLCDGLDSDAKIAEGFLASGARLACLCPPGAVPVALALDGAAALAKAGARLIYYAGKPGGGEVALSQADVAGFIFAGCDVRAILEGAHACAA